MGDGKWQEWKVKWGELCCSIKRPKENLCSIEHGVPLIANISVTNFRCQFTLTALKSNKKKTGRHIWNYFNTLENDEDFDSLQCFIDECFKRIVMGKPNTVQTPSNKHAPSTKRSGPEDSPEPASPQTSGTVNILQMTDKIIIFLIYGLLNRVGPVQEKCQFLRPIWSQWFPERTMRDIRQGSIIKYCLTWFNNKFLQESIIWEKVVQLKFCVLVTPPLLLDSINQKRKQPNN